MIFTIEEARDILRIDGSDNDAIITPLIYAIPPYLESTTGYVPETDTDGNETFAAARVNVEESVMFRINYRDDITTAHVIRYKETLYNITRADVYEGYKKDLTLYCKRRS